VRYEGLDIGEGITDHPIEVTGEGITGLLIITTLTDLGMEEAIIDLHFAHIGVVGIIDGIK